VAKRVIATDDGAGRRLLVSSPSFTGREAEIAAVEQALELRPLFPEWADELPPAPEPVDDATTARYRAPGHDRCRQAARDLDQFPGPWPPARSLLSSDGDQLSGGKAAEYR
jgi:hypothetical protein